MQRIDEQHQGKGHGSTESSVRHHELVHVRQLVDAEAVGDVRQNDHAHRAEDGAEENRQHDEPNVPLVVVLDGGHAEEHEDDGLRGAGQHLQGVLDGRVRLVRDVRLDVVLHSDAAEGDAGGGEQTDRKRINY